MSEFPQFMLEEETPDYFSIRHQNGQIANIPKMGTEELHPELRSLPSSKSVSPSMSPGASGAWDAPTTEQSVIPAAVTTETPMPEAPKMPAPTQAIPDGYAQQIQGLQGSADAQAKGQLEVAKAQDLIQQHLMATQDYYADKRAALDEDQTKLQKEYGKEIDPNHFWNKQTGFKGGMNRVLSMVGLFLGGHAQNKTGVNPAGAMLDKAIQQDIDAQKENLGKTKNLLSMNHEKYGDLRLAEQATKADMLTAFQAQLAKIAAETNSVVVKKNADFQIGQINVQKQLLNDQLVKEQTAKKIDQIISTQPIPDSDLHLLNKDQQSLMVRVGPNQNVRARTEEDAKAIKEAQPAIDNAINLIQDMRAGIRGYKEVQTPKGIQRVPVTKIEGALFGDLPGLGSATGAGREGRNMQDVLKTAFRDVGKSPLRISEYSNESYLNSLIPNPAQYHSEEALNALDRLEKELRGKVNTAQSQRLMGYDSGNAAPSEAAGFVK